MSKNGAGMTDGLKEKREKEKKVQRIITELMSANRQHRDVK